MKNLFVLLTIFLSLNAFSNVRELGNGVNFLVLEGFEPVKDEKGILKNAISVAIKLVEQIDTEKFPQLRFLEEEILGSRYIRVHRSVYSSGNRKPGDYTYGSWLLASTEPYRGAPTKIYDKSLTRLKPTQLSQLVIHEALHRSLPYPLNESEKVVTKITNIITQYERMDENLQRYFEIVKEMRLTWKVYPGCGPGCMSTFGISDLQTKVDKASDLIQFSTDSTARLHIYTSKKTFHIWDRLTKNIYTLNESDYYTVKKNWRGKETRVVNIDALVKFIDETLSEITRQDQL